MILNLFGFVIFTMGRFVLPRLALCFRMFSVAVLDHELNRSKKKNQIMQSNFTIYTGVRLQGEKFYSRHTILKIAK